MQSKKFKFLCLWSLLGFSQHIFADQIRLPGTFRSGSEMGEDVEIEGDFALVSVPGTRGADDRSGLVSSYQKIEGEWVRKENLFPADGLVGDNFGWRLSLDGRRLAVAASSDNAVIGEDFFPNLGSVYVYELDNEDNWQQTAKILPSDLESDTFFGTSISLDGDRMIVSASGGSGSVYVYDLLEGDWLETAKITDSNGQGNSIFGRFDIILDDDHAFISMSIASGENTTGQVNVYQKIGDDWDLKSEITSAENLNDDYFGWSLGYHDSRLAIGADTVANNQGAVYIYEQEGASWLMKTKIDLPANSHNRFFAYSVELSMDQLFVGALHDDASGIFGAVHVFNYTDSEWDYVTKIIAEDTSGNSPFLHNDFGNAISVDHDQVLIGAKFLGVGSGAAYISDVEPNGFRFEVNEGLNGAWFNPETSGQGIFLDVNTAADFSFMGLFTYDTALAVDDTVGQIGAAGQRWLVAGGEIDAANSLINFDLYYAYDGLFDDPTEVSVSDTTAYGWLTMDFQDCSNATVSYGINGANLTGSFPVIRPAPASGDLCEELATTAQGGTQNDEFDYALNGGWYNPETSGQGIFIDKFKGMDTAFMGWFTYDSEVVVDPINSAIGAEGQRWLVGTGTVDPMDAKVINYQLYYTYGGLFDDPTEVTVIEPGTYGNLRIEFIDCANANVEYSIESENLSGAFTMVRSIPNGISCGEPPEL